MRASLIALFASAAVAAGTVPASAAVPEHGSYEINDTFVDAEYCAAFGFAFDVVQHEVGSYEIYSDNAGSFVKAIVHAEIQYTLSANGKTLFERDRVTEIYTPDGERQMGLWAHIQGDQGLVLRDAGRLVFDADGRLLRADGPHPQFFGETFCAALAG